MPGIRVVGESVACESTVKSEIEEGIAAAMQDVVEALTKPLTPEEKFPKQQTGKTPRVAFKGSLQEVNRFYYSKGWTDGLPIIPPTEEAVQEMMTGTDLPPDHILATIIPRKGKATVEKIAINAVMAGALPTYMPVLIAAVQSFDDPKTRFDTFEVSTGSWAPFLAINGRIRNDININCSSGALSPGNIANAAIGRAVGLIVKNIGGARKAVEDMGVIGNPGKYSLVIGEDEEESPWEPLSVERGFKKEDSVVTLFGATGLQQLIDFGSNSAEKLVATLGRTMGFSFAAGINLYATVATLGLLGRFAHLKLPGELDVVTNWWVIGTTNSDAGGVIQFTDLQATNEQRFYRFGQTVTP